MSDLPHHALVPIERVLSARKARKILRDGRVHGRPLTPKQRRYFGWIAGGKKRGGRK